MNRIYTLLICTVLIGCGPKPKVSEPIGGAPQVAVQFQDVTKTLGVKFDHFSGARGKKYMPETVGSGIAFFDFDGDGRLDILFINSTDWPDSNVREPHYPKLYHNDGGDHFTDVTVKAGLHRDVYGMGAAIGDFDNDGRPDIYLTCLGPNFLYHNNGNGTFSDVTGKAGVAGVPVEPGGIAFKWSSTATFCDYDKDGTPDLFVCNYVKWTPKTDVVCRSRGGLKAYCAPGNYEGVPCTLYHGRGDGTFEDVSAKMGILAQQGKSFGCVVADFNGDGWPDIAVTNDTDANFLFLSDKGKRFKEMAREGGFAVNEMGLPKAGMGIDAADFQNNGRLGLVTGNFAKECISLYENDGAAIMRDRAYPLGVAQPSINYLTFGMFFFDYDLDGRQDIFAANGHIDDFVHESDASITYQQRALLYHNVGGKFEEVGEKSGPALLTKVVGRGCAWGDLDLDGRITIGLISNNERGVLWRTVDKPKNHWIGLRLTGKQGSTRDAWGARISVESSGLKQSTQIMGGGSFLSTNQKWPLFGLGAAQTAESIVINWPSGKITKLNSLAAGTYYDVTEGEDVARPVVKSH